MGTGALTMNKKVKVFAPVSIGNVSVGFDSLGLALTPIDGQMLGDVVIIKSTEGDSHFVLKGRYASRLPDDPERNVVWQIRSTFEAALQQQGITPQPMVIKLKKHIPVCSGLGSSACSVVAALVALNAFYDQPFDQQTLLRMMGEAEATISGSVHFDNVAPSFLGGMQLMLSEAEQVAVSVPLFEDIYWVLAYPDVLVSTQAARERLPQQYDRSTLIRFGQNLAGFVSACYRQDADLAFALLKDEVAEPYRAELLPNFNQTKQQLLRMGSLAAGISGSGPTLFSACDDLVTAQAQAVWLKQHYLQSDEGFVAICQADTEGARILS